MKDSEIARLGTVKALANPVRQRILALLHDGPATSTTLAKALGITTGGTSYNLRVLAEHGLVEEMPGHGRGRERWWRHVPVDLRFPGPDARNAEMRAALGELEREYLAADVELFDRFQRARGSMGPWGEMPYSRGEIRVTLDELERFFDEYIALVMRYSRSADQAPAGARRVHTRFLALPEPEPTPEPTPGPRSERGPEGGGTAAD